MRKPIDYTVYQTYSTSENMWWTVYQFYPEGKWDGNNRTLEEALVVYPKDTYDWNLGSMNSTLDDVFDDLIRIRDECDPVMDAFLAFIERDMTTNPDSIKPVDMEQKERIAQLVEGVEFDCDQRDDAEAAPETRMNRYWEVKVYNDRVVIEPPQEIDHLYDDLWLHVTGNILEEDKIEIASKIASVLNAHFAS